MKRTTLLISSLFLAAALLLHAQSPSPEDIKKHDDQLLSNFAGLDHYQAANAKILSPTPNENRVVFLGASNTEFWNLATYFPNKPYINRGISGQTTRQMLLRFRQDVVSLRPKVVVILAGTNDIAGNAGPETLEELENNLASMADIATANHIRVVLCSITPSVDFPWKRGLNPAPKIVAVNAWIKAHAAQKGYTYVDYHSALKDNRDGLPPELTTDGVHLKRPGYLIMTNLAEAGIQKALASKSILK